MGSVVKESQDTGNEPPDAPMQATVSEERDEPSPTPAEPVAQLATTRSANEVAADEPSELSEPRQSDAPTTSLSGALRPPPMGRFARGLVYATGLFLLRPVLLGIRWLIGWRRTARLAVSDEAVVVDSTLSLLGTALRREQEHIPYRRVMSVGVQEGIAPEPLVYGLLALAIGVIWGGLLMIDGIFGRSFGLVGMGLGVLIAAVAVDLVLFWGMRLFPQLHHTGLVLRLSDGRRVIVSAPRREAAERLRDLVGARLS